MGRKKRGLGSRGLNVLLNGQAKVRAAERGETDAVVEKPVTRLQPGRWQPRRHFDEAALAALAESIRTQGIVQPLVVRPLDDGGYEIVAGERRWRAAQLAGLETVPVVVREMDDRTALAIGLIENIQREDLNPIEQAQGMQRLLDEFGLTHESLAEALGLSRAQVTNMLRLLRLPETVQAWVRDGRLSMGHARALLSLPATLQVVLGQKAIDQGWSVRQMEQQVKAALADAERTRRPPQPDPDIAALETRLAERLGAEVAIRHGRRGQGRIEIRYSSLDDLQRLLACLQPD